MSDFTILPAIDLKGGRCVRLVQGRAENETVYSSDPVGMALHWQDQGARYLHVVDLDGAFQGHPVHLDVIAEIVKALDIPVEVGGGIRSDADAERLLERGVDRVIIGTRALQLTPELKRLLDRYPGRFAAGIDARDGRVQTHGWTDTSGVDALEFARQAEAHGFSTIIYTDTSRDGMLQGVNASAMDAMCAAVSCQVIASGGVTTAEDIRILKGLGRSNLFGAIVGKALYDHRVTFADLAQA